MWTEGSKPPSVRPDIRLSVCAVAGLPDGTDLHRRGFAVPSIPIRLRGVAAARSRWVNFLPSRVGSLAHRNPAGDGDRPAAARTSSIGMGGLVAVPAPAVSDSGRKPGRLSGRWGDFPHAKARESGSLCPHPRTLARQISASVHRSAVPVWPAHRCSTTAQPSLSASLRRSFTNDRGREAFKSAAAL